MAFNRKKVQQIRKEFDYIEDSEQYYSTLYFTVNFIIFCICPPAKFDKLTFL